MAGAGVDILGLEAYLKPLKGKAFKDVNRELRSASKGIANAVRPHVVAGVAASPAWQAKVMSKTVRVHSDRVPVLVVGKVNPRFRSGFKRPGFSPADARVRRGQLAAGVVKGPLWPINYYGIPRNRDWGTLGRALAESGAAMATAEREYREAYFRILRNYGFKVGR